MRWITALTLTTLLASLSSAGRGDDAEYRRRAAALKPGDVRSRFVLALWCEKKGMTDHARKHYAIVLDIQKDHRASRRALTRLQPDPKAVRLLVRRALTAKKSKERHAAVDVLRDMRHTRRTAPLFVPVLRARSPEVRTRAIEALAALGDKGAVRPLIEHLWFAGGNATGAYFAQNAQVSYIRDFDVEVA